MKAWLRAGIVVGLALLGVGCLVLALVWGLADDPSQGSGRADAPGAAPPVVRPDLPRGRERPGASGDRPDAEGSPTADGPEDARLLRVLVFDEAADEPVRGADVRVFPARPDDVFDVAERALPDDALVTATSDAEGRVVVRMTEEGRYPVLVRALRYAAQVAFVSAGDPEEIVLLVLERQVRLRVVDTFGAPVQGATLLVRQGDPVFPPTRTFSTDAGGRALVALGLWDVVEIHAAGLVPIAWTFQDEADTEVERVLVLDRGRSVAGFVRDVEGRAIAGARVQLEGWELPKSCRTDASGHFVFDRVLSMSEAQYGGFSVSADGYAGQYVSIETPGVVLEVVLELEVESTQQLHSIRGRVVVAGGGSVSEVGIVWQGESDWSSADAGDTGEFVIEGVSAGAGTLIGNVVADLDGSGRTTLWQGEQALDVTADLGDIVLRLEQQPHSFVSFQVLGPDGLALAGLTCAVDGSLSSGESLVTDQNGRVECVVGGPAGEELWVGIELPEGLVPPEQTHVLSTAAPGAPPTVLRVRAAARYDLLFADAQGTPLDATDAAFAEEAANYGFEIRDDRVRSVVHLVEPQVMTGRIPGVGPYRVEIDPAVTPPGDVLVRVANGARIVGRVTVEGGGVPEAMIQIAVETSDDYEYGWEDVRVGRGGTFSFAGLPPGTFQLMVLTPESTVLAMRIGQLELGRTLDLGDVSADASGWVTVQLIDLAGKPAAGAHVEYRYGPSWGVSAWEVSDEDGAVRGPSVPGTELVLGVTGRDGGIALVASPPDAAPARVQLVAPAELVVVARNADALEQNVGVFVRPPGVDAWIQHDSFDLEELPGVLEEFRGNSGAMRITALPPGQVRIIVHFADERGFEWSVERVVTVRAGETQRVEIDAGSPPPAEDE